MRTSDVLKLLRPLIEKHDCYLIGSRAIRAYLLEDGLDCNTTADLDLVVHIDKTDLEASNKASFIDYLENILHRNVICLSSEFTTFRIKDRSLSISVDLIVEPPDKSIVDHIKNHAINITKLAYKIPKDLQLGNTELFLISDVDDCLDQGNILWDSIGGGYQARGGLSQSYFNKMMSKMYSYSRILDTYYEENEINKKSTLSIHLIRPHSLRYE